MARRRNQGPVQDASPVLGQAESWGCAAAPRGVVAGRVAGGAAQVPRARETGAAVAQEGGGRGAEGSCPGAGP